MKIRPATVEDAGAIASVHIRSWWEAFSSILSAEQIAAKDLDEASQTAIWTKRLMEEEGKSRFTFVATEEERLIAYVTGGKIRGTAHDSADDWADAELHQIYVLAEAQGKGIGKALVVRLAQELSKQGFKSLIVWVMTLNPAVAFYRDALGGKFITERPIPEVNGSLKEAAYGWSSLEVLK